MQINVTIDNLTITKKEINNSGEYNARECEYTFSNEYNNLIKKAIFTNNQNVSYQVTINNSTSIIPSEVLLEKGNVKIGVYAYEVQDNELVLRYSPAPTYFYVDEGSYIENPQNATPPTPTELQVINEQLQEMSNKIDEKANTSDLANVATSGDYNDLINTPTIPEVPTKTSDLINDSGFIDNTVNDLVNYELKTNTGSSIELSINSSTYVMTLSLKNSAGTILNTQTIDLPLESVVVNGSYDATNQKIVLTLQNGNTIDIPVGALVSGLQSEITSQNKLSSDLVDDTNNTNKFVTTSDKTNWNGKLDANKVKTSYSTTNGDIYDVSYINSMIGNIESVLETLDIGSGV